MTQHPLAYEPLDRAERHAGGSQARRPQQPVPPPGLMVGAIRPSDPVPSRWTGARPFARATVGIAAAVTGLLGLWLTVGQA